MLMQQNAPVWVRTGGKRYEGVLLEWVKMERGPYYLCKVQITVEGPLGSVTQTLPRPIRSDKLKRRYV